jgi:hypothetical protein
LVSKATVKAMVGQRLDHSTVQTSGGKTVGCEFYPITAGPLAISENLPRHGRPSVRITVVRYPSAESVRQVLATVSRAGGSPSRQSVGGHVAETYQTHFYPPDGNSDWACAFTTGSKLVTVFVADPTSSGQTDALDLARNLAPHAG